MGEIILENNLEDKLDIEEIYQLKEVICTNQNCFSNVLGKTDIVTHDVELTKNDPVLCKSYHRDPRPCIDYRKLNQVTKIKFFQLPNIEERIETVSSANYITLDLSRGYWQIPLSPNAQRYTVFLFWTYKPLRMPFGLENVPYEFSRMISQILDGCEEFAVPYLDDIVIYSRSFKEHIKHIRKVLRRIQHAGLTIKLSKYKFAQGEVKYLGHVVGQNRRNPSELNLEAIQNFPRPSTKTDIRAFLGLAGYYSKYISMLSFFAAPLTEALEGENRKGSVVWTEHCEETFLSLKKALISFPVLNAPDYQHEFILQPIHLIEGHIVHSESEDEQEGTVEDGPEPPSDDSTTPRSSIKWRFEPFSYIDTNISSNTSTVSTPLQYFIKYIPSEMFSEMTTYTNMYALQKGVSFKPTTKEELEVLFGLHIIMGTLKYPRVNLYWDNSVGIPTFVNCMTRDSVRNRCLQLPVEKICSVDEQIVPFRGNLNIKQYMKNKPNPWGIKIFILCGISGIAYDFIVYQGSTTEFDNNLLSYGQSAAVVLQLSKRFVSKGHELYFDNYFNSYNLLQILKSKSINAAGTARLNRFSKPPLSSDKECRTKGRGFSQEITSLDGDVALVKWVDNRSVVLASNFLGINKEDEVQRWSKESKSFIKVKRPEIVRRYNSGMGGVDLLDQLIALYRTNIRSKKWTLRMIFHAVDLAIVNSWIEYKNDMKVLSTPSKNILDLMNFRLKVADGLVNVGKQRGNLKRGRPSLAPPLPKKICRKPFTEIKPSKDLRTDQIDHMPDHDNAKYETRCKKKKIVILRPILFVLNVKSIYV
ncbi:Retrovirus-related Pol polyprotein from transposon 297 [Araneus ventricosus]|uniref:RNA-directed DNA polymerase n=1 Tax=Araneus ventricosus TaxID=182803 RepID=A0A4Y2QUV1_ARAVE|nr:Retrovirus-related Pol polyprotein from transposon 297 [Araneus ventricosus]